MLLMPPPVCQCASFSRNEYRLTTAKADKPENVLYCSRPETDFNHESDFSACQLWLLVISSCCLGVAMRELEMFCAVRGVTFVPWSIGPNCWSSVSFTTETTLADPGGACTPPPPPTGSNSFVFAYVFTKKHLRQRPMPPNGSALPQQEILGLPLN